MAEPRRARPAEWWAGSDDDSEPDRDKPDGDEPDGDDPDGAERDRPAGPDPPDLDRPAQPDGGEPDRDDPDGAQPDSDDPDGAGRDRPAGPDPADLDRPAQPDGDEPDGDDPNGAQPDGDDPDGDDPDGAERDRPAGQDRVLTWKALGMDHVHARVEEPGLTLPDRPAVPSWGTVLATTLRLWLERRGLRKPASAARGARPSWRKLGLAGLVLVVFAAGALTVVLIRQASVGAPSGPGASAEASAAPRLPAMTPRTGSSSR